MVRNKAVENFFNTETKRILDEFRNFDNSIPHYGEKGSARETRISKFLAKHLPKRYGVGSGFIIDSQGNISAQTDIVIYDAIDGMHIPFAEDKAFFPVESVYAVIEVKSKLNIQEIESCLSNLSKLRNLYKLYQSEHILSCVFSYSTIWNKIPESYVIEWFFRKGQKLGVDMPDMTVVLEEQSFMLSTAMGKEDRYSILHRRQVLLRFFSYLIARMSHVKTTLPDLWDQYTEWLSHEPIAAIVEESFFTKLQDEISRGK